MSPTVTLILGNIKIIKMKRKYFYIYCLRYLIWVGDKDDVDRACAEPLLVSSLARRHSVLDRRHLVGPVPSFRAGDVASPHREGLRWVPACDKAGLSPCSNFSLSLAGYPADASNPRRQATRNRTCMDRWLTLQRTEVTPEQQ